MFAALHLHQCQVPSVFFFNDTATTEIYTLSLHDALPISPACELPRDRGFRSSRRGRRVSRTREAARSEEHTSELQSPDHLVCRLLLEKKKNKETRRRNIITQVLTTS